MCTVNCVCMLTLVHGSCTSFLQWLRLCLPLCCQPRRRELRNPRECTNPTEDQTPLLSVLFYPLLASLLSFQFPAKVGPAVTVLTNPFLHLSSLCPNPLLLAYMIFFFMPAVNDSHLNLTWFVAQYVCRCTEPLSDGESGRGPLYTLCSAILGTNIQ